MSRLLMVAFCLALIVLVVSASASPAWGQSRDTTAADTSTAAGPPTEVVGRVERAFAKGDVERLLVPATDRIEVGMFGAQSFYSGSQAFYVLGNFFEDYDPRTFVTDDVTKAGTSYFVSGTYEHGRSDRPLRVYVRLVEEEDRWHLHEVRIDRKEK